MEIDGAPVFIDSGTYLYTRDVASRLHFKGARAHNTLLIDDREPMISLETFKWVNTVRGRTVWFSGGGDCKVVGSVQVLPSNRAEFHHERLVIQAGDRIWIVIDRLSAPHRDPDGKLHRAGVLFHTPLVAECFELQTDTRVALRLPAGTGGPGGSTILEGFSSGDYQRRIISDHSDRRTWYSPAYGELRHGTTVEIGVDFAEALMLVHTFAGDDVGFACHPQTGDRVRVDVEREGRHDELDVYFAPMRIDWNQRPLAEDR